MTTKDHDLTPEDIIKLDAEFRRAHDEYTKEIMHPVVDVYIDLPLLIDYKLGALLFIYKDNEVAWNYIQHIVKTEYNALISKHIASKFPRLDITDGDVYSILINQKYTEILSKLSPLTTVHDHVFIFIQDLYNNNIRFNDKDKSKINLYINNPYFELPEEVKYYFKYVLLKNVATDIYFINDGKYEDECIKKCDYLFIDNISDFHKSSIVIEMFKEPFVDKTICCAYMSDLDNGRIDSEGAGKYFKQLFDLMNIRTDFKFIHKCIPIKKEDKQPS